ncbi:7304_t:CDS:2, partial [Funneliformis mosseae]
EGCFEKVKWITGHCMDAIPNQSPTIPELINGHYGKEIKEGFEETEKKIPNMSISHKANPNAIFLFYSR